MGDHSTLNVVMARWWLIVAVAIVAMVVSYFFSESRDPVFESTSTFVLAVDPAIQDPGDVAAALGVLRNRQITATYAEMMQSRTLLDRAVRQIGGSTDDYMSSSVVLPESNVVSLMVSGPAADSVQELNGLVGASARDDLATTYPIYYAILLESPKTPSAPTTPVPVRDAVFGAAIGAFLGLVLAAVWPASNRDDLQTTGIDRRLFLESNEVDTGPVRRSSSPSSL